MSPGATQERRLARKNQMRFGRIYLAISAGFLGFPAEKPCHLQVPPGHNYTLLLFLRLLTILLLLLRTLFMLQRRITNAHKHLINKLMVLPIS